MFIPRDRHHCNHCSSCKWCHTRNLVKDCFTLRDGPVDHRFCDGDCAAKWVKYRHMIGVAHVVRMPPCIRAEYLEGKTIDEFISDGMVVKCARKPS